MITVSYQQRQTSLYDVEAQLKSGLDIIDDICLFGATLYEKQLIFSTLQAVDLRYQGNYNELIPEVDNENTHAPDTDKALCKAMQSCMAPVTESSLGLIVE
jgi:hypothetical protein